MKLKAQQRVPTHLKADLGDEDWLVVLLRQLTQHLNTRRPCLPLRRNTRICRVAFAAIGIVSCNGDKQRCEGRLASATKAGFRCACPTNDIKGVPPPNLDGLASGDGEVAWEDL